MPAGMPGRWTDGLSGATVRGTQLAVDELACQPDDKDR